ncbi:MAG: ABC transporter permease [Deltaproteobacteria bacterium]|nr:ABC transporter permease [Deltaproteobacteria bacterium]
MTLEIAQPNLPKAPEPETGSPRYWGLVWKQFKKRKLNMIGLWVILILVAIAILAPLLANSEPVYVKYQDKVYLPILQKLWPISKLNLYPELTGVDLKDWKAKGAEFRYTPVPYSPDDYNLEEILEPPSIYHWLGTDQQGRDVLSRLIHGSRISLSVGLIAVGIYTLIGIFLGALAGYFGGRWDMLLSRLIEIMICFPTFFLILALVAVLGQDLFYIMLVIGLTGWTGIARLTRGEFLKLRNQDFVTACLSQGMPTRRILFRHLLPNAMAPVMVSATFGIASAILIESSLSFLGFGVRPPTPSWGELLSQAKSVIDVAWWLTTFPGMAIFLTITAFNLVGEGLRDAVDPKLKS